MKIYNLQFISLVNIQNVCTSLVYITLKYCCSTSSQLTTVVRFRCCVKFTPNHSSSQSWVGGNQNKYVVLVYKSYPIQISHILSFELDCFFCLSADIYCTCDTKGSKLLLIECGAYVQELIQTCTEWIERVCVGD